MRRRWGGRGVRRDPGHAARTSRRVDRWLWPAGERRSRHRRRDRSARLRRVLVRRGTRRSRAVRPRDDAARRHRAHRRGDRDRQHLGPRRNGDERRRPHHRRGVPWSVRPRRGCQPSAGGRDARQHLPPAAHVHAQLPRADGVARRTVAGTRTTSADRDRRTAAEDARAGGAIGRRGPPVLRARRAHGAGAPRSSDRLACSRPNWQSCSSATRSRPGGWRRIHTSSFYLGAPNYVENLRWLGFTDDDLADGGSDALVDAIVAWGDDAAIRRRVREHLDAGADHVCIQPVTDWDVGPRRSRCCAASPRH